jgi:DNA repair protein RecO (recombination protein O)
MRSFKTEGIILRRRNFKDADRILTVYTKDQGKIIVKATGVRKITSRRSSHIELLNHARLGLYQGPGNFPILTEATVVNSFDSIKQNLQSIGFAYHICELIDGLCPEGEAHDGVFDLLQKTLRQLASKASEDLASIRILIQDFEIKLLSILGYWHQDQTVPLTLDTHEFIENIMERKLRSRNMFAKL